MSSSSAGYIVSEPSSNLVPRVLSLRGQYIGTLKKIASLAFVVYELVVIYPLKNGEKMNYGRCGLAPLKEENCRQMDRLMKFSYTPEFFSLICIVTEGHIIGG